MKDNYQLWREHEERLERETSKYPICEHCGEPIFDKADHGREEGYVGLHKNKGIFVSDEDAYAYAFEQCVNGSYEDVAEFKEMLVEWFYSGNWARQTVCE